jgi:hypothetical protein
MQIQTRQSGNVLFLIFIAIGLFAALTYAVSDGTRGGTKQLSDTQAKLMASEVIAFHASVKQAVEQLQQWGCSEQELYFGHESLLKMNGNLASSPNPNMKQSCRIFYDGGGGILPITQSNASVQDSLLVNANAFIPGTTNASASRWNGIGSSAGAELGLVTFFIKEEVCREINRLLKVNNGQPILVGPAQAMINDTTFMGQFPSLSNYRFGVSGEEAIIGKPAFCFKENGQWAGPFVHYYFMSVLIPR